MLIARVRGGLVADSRKKGLSNFVGRVRSKADLLLVLALDSGKSDGGFLRHDIKL
jgi:hypothetical protein